MSLGKFLLLVDDSSWDVPLQFIGFAGASVCLFGEVNFLGVLTDVLCFVEDVDVEAKVKTLSHFSFADFFGEFRGTGSVSDVDCIDVDCVEAIVCSFSAVIITRNAFRHISKRFCGEPLFFFSDVSGKMLH